MVTVFIEICEKIIISIPQKKTLILKFLKLSLLFDLRTTKDAIIHNIGTYRGKMVLL
tara:strand:+ start:696 stop:866 length:171 start_codon:yes stop_codon:yes gene_type:complete